jgi:two-component system sensor histidine kinase UhpB
MSSAAPPAVQDPPTESPAGSTWPREELFFTLAYLALGTIWIVASDRALAWMTNEPMSSVSLQTCKGLNFVITTGLLFYLVLRRSFSRRRRAEAASRSVAQRFALAGRAATDVIWDWDLTDNSIWWSEGFQKVFGYGSEEIESTIDSWVNRLHPDERESVVNRIHADIDAGRDAWSAEYRFRRKNGTYAAVSDRGYIIKDPEGKPIRMVGGITDITQKRAAAELLDRSRRQLRALLAKTQTMREEERTRIAREIHDELGQQLTALKMDLCWMEKKLTDMEGSTARLLLEKVVESTELADATITTVQKITTDLRPGALDQLGLSAALRQEADAFAKRTGIRCLTQLPEDTKDIPSEAATVVFRIFQETLTNVTRHAKATEVRARLTKNADGLELRVEDNGQGIRMSDISDPKSLGLWGMKERAAALRGTVEISATSPHGTLVLLTLPLKVEAVNFAEMI